MEQNGNLNFVMVGHVDHGKSTLIGRLLYDTNSLMPDRMEEVRKRSAELGRKTEFAYLLDHLEEERKQGITIDTTQVFFKTDQRHYVIIDAPGHVEFVRNMITGASQAEAAVLIVDVKEGVQEQTRRHSYMLSLLGIEQVVVVLNKMDLADYDQGRFGEVKEDTEKFLQSIGMSGSLYVPISAIEGENIVSRSDKLKWYDGPTFLESLDKLENRKPAENKPLLFPIQDVYKIGDKRMNVGRVESGKIKAGENIKVLPDQQETSVNTVEKFLEETTEAQASESIGMTTTDSIFLDRGNVVCRPGAEPLFTSEISANLFWMSKRPFEGEKLTMRCATQYSKCKIKKIKRRIDSSSMEVLEENASKIGNLEVAEVIIETKRPIAVKNFNDVQELGRFVLVRDENICAGGIITEMG